MNDFYTIGVDVGGTHIDAVLVGSEENIVATAKSHTTADIVTGFSCVLDALLKNAQVPFSSIQGVFLGTTHATNAILQKRELYKVGLIRLAGHYPESLPPCFDWPQDLKETLFAGYKTIGGGYECDGSAITSVCPDEAREAIQYLLDCGAESIAIVGTFSPQNAAQERQIGALVSEIAPEHFPITLSHEIGGVGFIERENSAILNGALKKVIAQGFKGLEKVCREQHLECPLFITQNNGTIIDLQTALRCPILTISAGPTNSFIGASRLSGLTDLIVVDIGGTSTDIGLIKNGFPRRSLNTSQIGGVKLNFPMPDVFSLALGGGSHLSISENQITIGPKSVGKDIAIRAICFGGSIFTFTDAAVACGKVIPGTLPHAIPCSAEDSRRILLQALEKIHEGIQILEGEKGKLPVLLVGGGALLFPPEMLGERYIVPEYAPVANAYGAALSGISGVVDRIVSLTQREEVLHALQQEALQEAIRKGADPEDTKIADMQIIPYHYVPNNIARIVLTAAGKQMREVKLCRI